MTQSPYAHLTGELEPLPTRTSVLAILALIIAIVSIVPLFCAIPGSGALAVIFGGGALLLINRERGRLSGTGLAATGIVLGMIVTVVQVVAVMMVTWGLQKGNAFIAPVDTSMRALESGDLVGARTMLSEASSARVTDEMLADFAKQYQSAAGTYKGTPTSLLQWVNSWIEGVEAMKNKRQWDNTIPLPARFSRGAAMLAITMDPKEFEKDRGAKGVVLPVLNIGVITIDGKEAWLIDPATLPPQTRVNIGPRPPNFPEPDTSPVEDPGTDRPSEKPEEPS